MGRKTKTREWPALVVLSEELGPVPTPQQDVADKLAAVDEAIGYHLNRRALLIAAQADNDQRLTALRHLHAAYLSASSHWPAAPTDDA